MGSLNKLRCHAHFQFEANQITWTAVLIEIHIFKDKQCRSRSVGTDLDLHCLLRQGMSCLARDQGHITNFMCLQLLDEWQTV